MYECVDFVIEHGSVAYDRGEFGDLNHESTATLSCETGFYLQGESVYTCLEGEWRDSQGNAFDGSSTCEIYTCPDLSVENGEVEYEHSSVNPDAAESTDVTVSISVATRNFCRNNFRSTLSS